ncbi:hypothetical protein DFJ74DRAFT_711798 [Hyaloraphidium curvatum]|nr:hypothetical protein DFJ74DRAFT_711798 [Hyaloraphidium curvatum]
MAGWYGGWQAPQAPQWLPAGPAMGVHVVGAMLRRISARRPGKATTRYGKTGRAIVAFKPEATFKKMAQALQVLKNERLRLPMLVRDADAKTLRPR